ncbi:MAG TPA: hypothetical protein PKA20_14185 [Burkholderiaceae bacterium]|nr:hypothetical protein [Burkholderiaceae bacterium]
MSPPAPEPPRSRSALPSVRIEHIGPIPGSPGRVEVVTRLNADQFLLLQMSHEQMEQRGLVVGAWIRVATRGGQFEIA